MQWHLIKIGSYNGLVPNFAIFVDYNLKVDGFSDMLRIMHMFCALLCYVLVRFLSLLHMSFGVILLTHRGRVMHIPVGKLTTIGSDNGLSPERRQAIIWNLNRNLYIFIQENAFENVFCEITSILSRPQCVKIGAIIWLPLWQGSIPELHE